MRKWIWLACVALGVASTAAYAVAKGGKLYIKARNTKLLPEASPTAMAIATLQPGMEVTWNGADPKDSHYHQVSTANGKGVVFQSNLSPSKPSGEIMGSDGKEVDPNAFASSAAATKALGDGPIKYGEGGDIGPEAVNQLMALESLAKKVDYSGHAKKAGIFEVVGKGGGK